MTATSLRGHPQSSEGLLDMSPPPALTPDQHSQATAIFNQIVSRYEPLQASRTSPSYKFITLLRTFHESVVSKDSFLYHFFSFIDEQSQQDLNPRRSAILDILPRFEDIHLWSSRESDDFQDILAAFSEFLVNNFFLPRRSKEGDTCIFCTQSLTVLQSKPLAAGPLNLPLPLSVCPTCPTA